MGNLPFETKEDDIRQMIEGHGLPSDLEEQAKRDGAAKNPGGKPLRWLKKIRLGTFEDSGLCKGYVEFITRKQCNQLTSPKAGHSSTSSIPHMLPLRLSTLATIT